MNVTQLHADHAYLARELVAAEVRAELARQRENSNSLPRNIGKSQRYWYERINARLPFSVDDLAMLSAYLKVPMSQFMPRDVVPDLGNLHPGDYRTAFTGELIPFPVGHRQRDPLAPRTRNNPIVMLDAVS